MITHSNQLTKFRLKTIKNWFDIVLPNRDIEILGRCDSMQKIRGYSVELRAIEATLLALNG